MKIDVKVKNLGKLKEAKFHIRPMTVITGPNGTGKSFFTKSLYSILNVINKNVYHESVKQTIRQIQLQLDALVGTIAYAGTHDFEVTEDIKVNLDYLQNEFVDASGWKINDYLAFATSKIGVVEKIQTFYAGYLIELNSKPTKINSIKSISEAINKNLGDFLLQLKNPQRYYADFFATHIENELKDNFQITTLSELISFGEEKIAIKIDELLDIELSDNKKSL
jgi:AAA15 family ATPase/GTPase